MKQKTIDNIENRRKSIYEKTDELSKDLPVRIRTYINLVGLGMKFMSDVICDEDFSQKSDDEVADTIVKAIVLADICAQLAVDAFPKPTEDDED